jgi:GT2 family glycosyltransferase
LVGYELKVIPESVIYHYAGATIRADSFKKLYWNHRNGIIALIKNLQFKNLIRVIGIRIILDIINVFYAGIIQFDLKHSYSIIKSHLWILFHIRFILEKRKKVQMMRTVDDEGYSHLMYPGSLVIQYFLKGRKIFKRLKF